MFRRSLLGGLSALALAWVVRGTDFYVSPDGTSGSDGSIASPWNLQHALDQPSGVHPGDTIWLRGGTYAGTFTRAQGLR